VAAAIAGAGAGWTASVPAFAPPPLGPFPAAELYREPGPAGCLTPAAGQGVALSLFVRDLASSLDPTTGLCALPYDWAGPAAWGGAAGAWPGLRSGSATIDRAYNSWQPAVRLGYRAGYGTIPGPVQQAAAIMAQQMYADSHVSGIYKTQRMGNLSYELNPKRSQLPESALALLAPYRRID
jgi:hypothetical protein